MNLCSVNRAVGVLTSRSSRRRRGADRCTACKRCPSRSPPASSSSLQTCRVLERQTNSFWRMKTYLLSMMSENTRRSHLLSQNDTPWVQRNHRWPREETLQLRAQNEAPWAPSSSGPSSHFSPLFIQPEVYDHGVEVGSAPSYGPEARLKTASEMIFIREWGGGGLWEVTRGESCILAPFWARWRPPRCASVGMNLPW